jgi:hypothetical protein
MSDTLTCHLKIAAELGVTNLPPYPQPPAQNKYVVAERILSVRKGPGSWNERIRYIHKGDPVTAMREQDGWAEIGIGEWCSLEYLRKVQP